MADCLGISLGKEQLGMAVVSRSGRERVVEFFGRYEYDGEQLDVGGRAAFAAARAAAYAGMPVALCLPGEDVFLQPQTVPFTKRSHIARTLAFEMEDKLPFDVEQAALDFAVVGRDGPNSRVLVAAARREMLQAAVEPFVARGLKVRLVTTDVLSTPALGELLGRDAYTILDVSPSGWKLALCEKGRLLFARAAPATGEGQAALVGWLRQSFMAVPEQLSRSVVFVCGAAAGEVDCQALSEELSVPVEKLVFPESAFAPSVGAEEAEGAFRASAAISAAAALSAGAGQIDLLAAARGRDRVLETLFGPLCAVLVLLTLLLGVQAWRYGGVSAGALVEKENAEGEARKNSGMRFSRTWRRRRPPSTTACSWRSANSRGAAAGRYWARTSHGS